MMYIYRQTLKCVSVFVQIALLKVNKKVSMYLALSIVNNKYNIETIMVKAGRGVGLQAVHVLVALA